MVVFAVVVSGGDVSPLLLGALAVLFGVVDGFFLPAVSTAPRYLVPRDSLTRVVAAKTIVARGAEFAGAPLGSWLLVVASAAVAFWVNAGLFAVSVVMLALTRMAQPQAPHGDALPDAKRSPTAPEMSVWADLVAGIRLIRGYRTLAMLLIIVFRRRARVQRADDGRGAAASPSDRLGCASGRLDSRWFRAWRGGCGRVPALAQQPPPHRSCRPLGFDGDGTQRCRARLVACPGIVGVGCVRLRRISGPHVGHRRRVLRHAGHHCGAAASSHRPDRPRDECAVLCQSLRGPSDLRTDRAHHRVSLPLKFHSSLGARWSYSLQPSPLQTLSYVI